MCCILTGIYSEQMDLYLLKAFQCHFLLYFAGRQTDMKSCEDQEDWYYLFKYCRLCLQLLPQNIQHKYALLFYLQLNCGAFALF